jgi:hypothetical protein
VGDPISADKSTKLRDDALGIITKTRKPIGSDDDWTPTETDAPTEICEIPREFIFAAIIAAIIVAFFSVAFFAVYRHLQRVGNTAIQGNARYNTAVAAEPPSNNGTGNNVANGSNGSFLQVRGPHEW